MINNMHGPLRQPYPDRYRSVFGPANSVFLNAVRLTLSSEGRKEPV